MNDDVTGLQSRAVHCILDKRSIVEDHHCDYVSKPVSRQACHNTECVGVWVLGEWSQVSGTHMSHVSSNHQSSCKKIQLSSYL